MHIRFAFAVNKLNEFESHDFCNANRFLIYEWVNNEFIFLKDEANRFKNPDNDLANGSVGKVKAIIDFLKMLDINVLVSIRFGKNIQLVNSTFMAPAEGGRIQGRVLCRIVREYEIREHSPFLSCRLFLSHRVKASACQKKCIQACFCNKGPLRIR